MVEYYKVLLGYIFAPAKGFPHHTAENVADSEDLCCYITHVCVSSCRKHYHWISAIYLHTWHRRRSKPCSTPESLFRWWVEHRFFMMIRLCYIHNPYCYRAYSSCTYETTALFEYGLNLRSLRPDLHVIQSHVVANNWLHQKQLGVWYYTRHGPRSL